MAEFVALVVTDNRLEQALQESCGGQVDLVKVGEFLKWLATDIHKEAGVELEAAQLEWKQVARSVNTAALGWFKAKACAV